MNSIAPPRTPAFLPSRGDSKSCQPSLRNRRSAVSMHTVTPVKRAKYAPRSRNGCWICRNRKVKCDEAQPNCTPCQRLGVVCDYTRHVSYKDDTPKILSKMAKLIDTAGCPVYDPTAKQIFHPYHPHLQQDYEEEHDNGFVVHGVSDYVGNSPSSSTGDSNMSGAHSLCSSALGASDNDEDEAENNEDNEDDEKYKPRSSHTVQQDLTSHNVTGSLSHRRPRLGQSIGADTGQVNFPFDICIRTTPGGPQQPQFPPPDFGVSDSTLRTERYNESSPSLDEANGASCRYYSSGQSQEHSLDHLSSCSITPDSSSSSSTRLSMSPSSRPDTYHEDSTISIASDPGENMRSLSMSVNNIFMHVLPTAWSQHSLPHQQSLHNAEDQAPYQPFKSEPGDFSRLVEEEDNALLYYLHQCYSRTDSATTIASTTFKNEQQNSSSLIFPVGYSLPDFAHHSGFHRSFST
ncbi:hypothetical protein V1505DRAFT_393239 [Lipomyces doorenjongii]